MSLQSGGSEDILEAVKAFRKSVNRFIAIDDAKWRARSRSGELDNENHGNSVP